MKGYVELRTEAIVEYDKNGESGNIFCILGKAKKVLTEQDRIRDYNEMYGFVKQSGSYEDALEIIEGYITLVEKSQSDSEM